jgi:hypothetical protein
VTSPQRAEAAAALMAALRDVADANERLQLAVAWVFEAFGDQLDAETVRMLPVRGGPERPGRPPVPIVNREQESRARLYTHPSVTGDETPDDASTIRQVRDWMAGVVDRVKREDDDL